MKVIRKMDESVIAFIRQSFQTNLDNENINRLIDAYASEYASYVVEEDGIIAAILFDENTYRIALLLGDQKEAIFSLFDAVKDEAKKRNIAKLTANVVEDKKEFYDAYGFVHLDNEEDAPFQTMDYLLQNDVIGKTVTVVIDHPYGSFHPHRSDVQFALNYGYVLDGISGDGDIQNAYVYGIYEPLEEFTGVVVGIIYHKDDYQSRWVVASPLEKVEKEDIIQSVGFEEQYYDTMIVI